MLARRREVENKVIKYFQLQWPRNEDIFTGQKIVVPYRAEENAFAFNDTEWFCRSDCYVITQKSARYPLGFLLALLNSRLYFQWLYHRGKRKGKMLELFQAPLSEIPIKQISSGEQKPFVDLVERILAVKRRNPEADTSTLEQDIDAMVFDLYSLSKAERAVVMKPIQ